MQHQVVSRDEWLAARKELLRKEKEFTRLRDQLSAERRALPWVKVEKTYVFDGPERQGDARRPVRRTQPARRQALHVRPRLDRRLRRLLVRAGSHRGRAACISSTTTCPMSWSSRAPLAKTEPFRQRMGWPSSGCRRTAATSTSTSTCRSRPRRSPPARPPTTTGTGASVIDEMSGRSVFYKDEAGQIFHTYSSFARGGEMFLGSYAFLDITPEGTRRNHQRQPHRLGAPSRPLRRRRRVVLPLPPGATMKLFYGWVIVGAGMVVTCIGMGTMMSLGVFLQPMSQDMGWSRAGISFAAVLNFLAMGFGSFFWGSLSDRFGTRAVVLTGGVLLGIGLIAASQATTLLAVPAPVRHPGRAGGGQLLCAADRDGDPLVHRATAASPWHSSRPAWGSARC